MSDTSAKRVRMARWLTGSGLEIGALHNPLPVPPGVQVRYVDRAPTEELQRHYSDIPPEDFVPISVIGDAQDLSAVASDSVDFVIANHLVEHLEDPIRGLQEMLRAIRPGGVLYVALPDPRATFDRHRDTTPVEHVLAEYRGGTAATREQHFAEWVDRVERNVHPEIAPDDASFTARVAALMEMDYSIHFHVWRPETFLDLLSAARREGALDMELLDFAACDGGRDNEFIFVFGKGTSAEPRPLPPEPGVSTAAGGDGSAAELSGQLQECRAALDAVQASLSFRLGYRLLAPARALRRRFGAAARR